MGSTPHPPSQTLAAKWIAAARASRYAPVSVAVATLVIALCIALNVRPCDTAHQDRKKLSFPEFQPPILSPRGNETTLTEQVVRLAQLRMQPFANAIWRSSYMSVFVRGDCVACFLVQIKNRAIWVYDPRNVSMSAELYHQIRMREALFWTQQALDAGWDIDNIEFVVSPADGVVTSSRPHTYRMKPEEAYPKPIFTVIGCNFSDNIPFPMVFGDLIRRAFPSSSALNSATDPSEWDSHVMTFLNTSGYFRWGRKIPKAVFRGSMRVSAFYKDRLEAERKCTYSGRGKLHALAAQIEDLDVGLSGRCGTKEYSTLPLSLDRQQEYKYQIYTEGNSFWADRLPIQLLSASAVLMQLTPCYQFFEHLLEEFVHYIPVDYFFSDVGKKMEWALAHDEEAEQIAIQGANFGRDHLTISGITRYAGAVLEEYGRNMVKRAVSVHPESQRYVKPVRE